MLEKRLKRIFCRTILFAKPKSVIFKRPVWSINKFSGFRSRYAIPNENHDFWKNWRRRQVVGHKMAHGQSYRLALLPKIEFLFNYLRAGIRTRGRSQLQRILRHRSQNFQDHLDSEQHLDDKNFNMCTSELKRFS